MDRTIRSKKILIVFLFMLCILSMAFSVGFSGALEVKAEVIAPTAGQFYMLDGAEVGMSSSNYGEMRFTTVIEQKYYEELSKLGQVRFYTAMGPIGFTPAVDEFTDALIFNDDGYANVYGVIRYGENAEKNILVNATVDITAKAYLTVTYENGTVSEKIYAERNDTTRSMRAVANVALVKGDYKGNATFKGVLESYLGDITRENEGQVEKLYAENSKVKFDEPVSGQLYLNAVKTSKVLSNATEVDIASVVDWNKVNSSEGIIVSVMGNDYSVVSRETDYGINLIYTDSVSGKIKTDYKIAVYSTSRTAGGAAQSEYEPARNLSEIFNYATNTSGSASISTIYGKLDDYTINDKLIVVGTRSELFKNSGLNYDAKLYSNGGYTIATRGNCIFLYGEDENTVTGNNQGNYYAVLAFAREYFGFEVVGQLPQPLASEFEITSANSGYSFGFAYDTAIYNIDVNESVWVKGGINKTTLPDTPKRSSGYGVLNTPVTRAFNLNGTTSSYVMSAYAITFEDYLKIAENKVDGLTKRMWNCGANHFSFSEEAPTTCTSCSSTTFTDDTATYTGFTKAKMLLCPECSKYTVTFDTESSCLANYNKVINEETNHSCSAELSYSENGAKSKGWHNADYVFPIQNYINEHPKWFGDNVIYACDTCQRGFKDDGSDASTFKFINLGEECTKAGCSGKVIKYYGTKTNKSPSLEAKVDSVGAHAMQPCFTAHGNEAEYKLMVAEAVKKVLNDVKYVDSSNDKNSFTVTVMDATTHCECDACTTLYAQYGSMSAALIKFCNDMTKFLDEWMDKNASYLSNWLNETNVASWWTIYNSTTKAYEPITDMTPYQRTINVYFFAYVHGGSEKTNGDKKAPVKWSEEENDWIPIDTSVTMREGKYCSTGVWLVTAADSFSQIPVVNEDGNYVLDADGNKTYYTTNDIINGKFIYKGQDVVYKSMVEDGTSPVRKDIVQWGIVSNDQAKMYLWLNSQSSKFTTLPFYSAALFDEGLFDFLNEVGVEYIYPYASSHEENALSAYNNLKMYVTARRMYDKDANLDELVDTWFNGAFVDEEVISLMREAFNYEMTMAIKANYLRTHYLEGLDDEILDSENINGAVSDDNTGFVGNSQGYTSLTGPYGRYWSINELIELSDKYANIYSKAELNIKDPATLSKVKAMIDCEWYMPLMMILRYYQNDALVIARKAEFSARFKEIIDKIGISMNAEYNIKTSPVPIDVYYMSFLELELYDTTEGRVLDKNEQGQIIDVINGSSVVVYDSSTGELTLFEGETYEVRIKNSEEIKKGNTTYAAGTLLSGSSAKNTSSKLAYYSLYGRYDNGNWPEYYSIGKSGKTISCKKGYSSNYYDFDPARAWAKSGETINIAGGVRKIAREYDELNIRAGLRTSNWLQAIIFNCRVTLVSKIV